MEAQSPQILATPKAYALLTDPRAIVPQEAVLEEVMRLIRGPKKSDMGFAGGIFGGTPFSIIMLWANKAGEENIFVISTNFLMDYKTREQVRMGNHDYIALPID